MEQNPQPSAAPTPASSSEVENQATAPEAPFDTEQTPSVILVGLSDRLTKGERLALLVIAGMMMSVLGVARWLNPYDARGQPLRLGTHEQLRLPACGFYRATGLPCPTCGMTTSFSLCLHGDWHAAWQAHCLGPVLVVSTAIGAVWFSAAGFSGRRLGLPSWHLLSTVAAWTLLVLILGTWLVRLAMIFMRAQ
jgi:sugar phosphate permease